MVYFPGNEVAWAIATSRWLNFWLKLNVIIARTRKNILLDECYLLFEKYLQDKNKLLLIP